MSNERRGRLGCLWRRSCRVAPFVLLFVGAGEVRRHSATTAVRTDRQPPIDVGPATARADINWGYDSDFDGLPDEVECLVGGVPFLADTDGDGFGDAIEFVCGSRIDDPTSTPTIQPSLRLCAFETGGVIRVFCALYPAGLDLVSTFRCLIGSPNFTNAPEGDPGTGIGMFDITSVLPSVTRSYTHTSYLGLDLVGFTFDLDKNVVMQNAPVNLACVAKLAGVVCCDQLLLTTQGPTHLVLAGGPAISPGLSGYAIQPLDPSGSGEDQEYCSLGFDSGQSVGVGSIQYSVTSASCQPDGLLFCVGADCTALAGQKILMIDYGFLQSKGGQ
jgi:hypothetical protein